MARSWGQASPHSDALTVLPSGAVSGKQTCVFLSVCRALSEIPKIKTKQRRILQKKAHIFL